MGSPLRKKLQIQPNSNSVFEVLKSDNQFHFALDAAHNDGCTKDSKVMDNGYEMTK